MRRIILESGEAFTNAHLKRTGAFNAEALSTATAIVADVRQRGDVALRELTERFDGVRVEDFRVSEDALAEAASRMDADVARALRQAAEQIRDFHERQKQQSWFFAREDGALVGSKVIDIRIVGIYVPGGRALYPSTVLMNALPAAVAGVERIVCVTPPAKDGTLDPAIVEACRICGVTEIYMVGGAQAVAALAYGTESIAPVDKITGPGNAYVAAAKKVVSGDVGIDMIAGPPRCAWWPIPRPILRLWPSTSWRRPSTTAGGVLPGHVQRGVCRCGGAHGEAAPVLLHARRDHLGLLGRSRACRGVRRPAAGARGGERHRARAFGAAHRPRLDALGAVRNAGAIFLGAWTPEAVGDYVAGPNHTLPTGGTARFSSPLSTDEFVKKSSVIQYSPAALARDADAVMAIARHEGLWAHSMSVEMRKSLLDAGGASEAGAAGASAGDGGRAKGGADA